MIDSFVFFFSMIIQILDDIVVVINT